MDTKTYKVTLDQFASAAAQLKAQTGIVIDTSLSSGTVQTHGVDLQWSYTAGDLTVSILDKPFYVPATKIWSPLQDVFGAPVA